MLLEENPLLPDYVPGQERYEEIREQFDAPAQKAPMVVGIAGKKRVGKDTAAKALVARGYTRIGFADELKEAALDLDPLIEGDTRLSVLVEEFGWEQAKSVPETRRLLQVLGTEVIRHRDGDFWVRSLERRWTQARNPLLVVPDVRFNNEVAWVLSQGGLIIEIVRPGSENDSHSSEGGVSYRDVVIRNTGTVSDLHAQVISAVWNKEIRP